MARILTAANAAEILEQVAAEEQRLQFARFDFDDAWRLGAQIVGAAREQGLPLVVAIRRHGQRLFHAALSGTSPSNDRWLERKSAVVDLFGHASFYVGAQALLAGSSVEAIHALDPERYAAHGGVFPIIVRHLGPVGTVGVSGLAQADDHAFVVEQLEMFLASEPRPPA